MRCPPPDHKRSSSTMPSWVILLRKLFACQYFWEPSWSSELNFISSEQINVRHSLAHMVWYWLSYSSCFSLCFIIKLGLGIIFLDLIISLFKWLQIVLVWKGSSTRGFNIFDVEVFFFTSRTIFFLNFGDIFFWPASWFYCSILAWTFQVRVLQRPKTFGIALWDFPTLFRVEVTPFSNSDNLVPLTINVLVLYIFFFLLY